MLHSLLFSLLSMVGLKDQGEEMTVKLCRSALKKIERKLSTKRNQEINRAQPQSMRKRKTLDSSAGSILTNPLICTKAMESQV